MFFTSVLLSTSLRLLWLSYLTEVTSGRKGLSLVHSFTLQSVVAGKSQHQNLKQLVTWSGSTVVLLVTTAQPGNGAASSGQAFPFN